MRILITGMSGFVGGHLVEALLAEGGHQILGMSRSANWTEEWSHLKGKVELLAADLNDSAAVEQVLNTIQPEWLFHLAGYANPGKSFREPDRCWQDNLTATRSLYDTIARLGLCPRIVFTSTGLVYGDPDGADIAFDERSVLKPCSPYAASKAAADLVSYQYARTHRLAIIRTRLFNQIGPRQSPDYAVANFARQIAAVEAGKQSPVIETGDLSSSRDITDVRDVVRALRLLMELGTPGEVYNAGQGSTWRIHDVLMKLISLSRVQVQVNQKIDPARKADTSANMADIRKIEKVVGWKPQYTLEQTLLAILNYWREKTARD